MRIAQIAPLIESVPPRLYGGTERIVSYLTEELVALGHDVTLFASGDSITAADLVPCVPKALRLDRSRPRSDSLLHADARSRARSAPTSSTSCISTSTSSSFRCSGRSPSRTVTTLHGRQDLPDLHAALCRLSATCRWSRSRTRSARRSRTRTSRRPSITACRPTCSGRPSHPRGGYLAFLGRISPEKRPDRAIAIARALGIPLKIAAKVDRVDEAYFRDDDRAAARRAGRRIHRRDQRAQKTRFPRRSAGAAVSDRLAGAVRPRHDRGDGLRHAGAGVPLRLGAGDHRRQASPARIVDTVDEAVARACRDVIALDRRAVRRRFEERFSADAHGEGLCRRVSLAARASSTLVDAPLGAVLVACRVGPDVAARPRRPTC